MQTRFGGQSFEKHNDVTVVISSNVPVPYNLCRLSRSDIPKSLPSLSPMMRIAAGLNCRSRAFLTFLAH